MPVRDAGAQAFASGSATPQPSHLGVEPSLVDEDQPIRIQIRLGLEPGRACRCDILAILLAGVSGLFFYDQP